MCFVFVTIHLSDDYLHTCSITSYTFDWSYFMWWSLSFLLTTKIFTKCFCELIAYWFSHKTDRWNVFIYIYIHAYLYICKIDMFVNFIFKTYKPVWIDILWNHCLKTMCISNHCVGKQNMFSFHSDFEFCAIFTHSCLQSCHLSLAKGLMSILNCEFCTIFTQLFAVMLFHLGKGCMLVLHFEFCMIFTHSLLQSYYFMVAKSLMSILNCEFCTIFTPSILQSC